MANAYLLSNPVPSAGNITLKHTLTAEHIQQGYRMPGRMSPFDICATENYGHTVRVGFYTTQHRTHEGWRNVGGTHAVTPTHVIDAMHHYYQTGELEPGLTWDDTPFQTRVLRGRS